MEAAFWAVAGMEVVMMEAITAGID